MTIDAKTDINEVIDLKRGSISFSIASKRSGTFTESSNHVVDFTPDFLPVRWTSSCIESQSRQM